MPLDPNISLGVGNGVTPLQNPLDMATKYQGLLNSQAQNKLIGASTAATQSGTAQTQQNTAQSADNAQQNKFTQFLALPAEMQTQSVARQLVDSNLASGIITQPVHDAAMVAIAGTRNREDLVNLAQRALQHTMTGPERAASLYGTGSSVNTGGTIQPGVTASPMQGGGFKPAGSAIPMTLTPGQASEMVPTVGPNNQPGAVPKSTLVTPTGQAPGGGMGPGSYRPASAPQAPAGFNPTGPAPAFAKDQEAYQQAQAGASDAVSRIAGLQKAREALSLIDSGRGTGGLQKIKQFMVTEGIAPQSFVDSVNDYATAKKYLLDYARNRPGVHSDQGLSAAIDSNASTDIPNKTALDITATNIGQERMNLAQLKAQQDPTGAGYLAHSQDFSTKYDRRAFAADVYSPADLKAMVAKMTPTERTKFTSSLAAAARYGMIQAPQ